MIITLMIKNVGRDAQKMIMREEPTYVALVAKHTCLIQRSILISRRSIIHQVELQDVEEEGLKRTQAISTQ